MSVKSTAAPVRLYTCADAARKVGFTQQTVRTLARLGRVPIAAEYGDCYGMPPRPAPLFDEAGIAALAELKRTSRRVGEPWRDEEEGPT